MSWRIVLDTGARNQLAKIPEPIRSKVESAIESLREDPESDADGYTTLKLQGSRTVHRLKVPPYRVLYSFSKKSKKVTVFRIDKRSPATYHRTNPVQLPSPHIHN